MVKLTYVLKNREYADLIPPLIKKMGFRDIGIFNELENFAGEKIESRRFVRQTSRGTFVLDIYFKRKKTGKTGRRNEVIMIGRIPGPGLSGARVFCGERGKIGNLRYPRTSEMDYSSPVGTSGYGKISSVERVAPLSHISPSVTYKYGTTAVSSQIIKKSGTVKSRTGERYGKSGKGKDKRRYMPKSYPVVVDDSYSLKILRKIGAELRKQELAVLSYKDRHTYRVTLRKCVETSKTRIGLVMRRMGYRFDSERSKFIFESKKYYSTVSFIYCPDYIHCLFAFARSSETAKAAYLIESRARKICKKFLEHLSDYCTKVRCS